jgi:hypothetical protein
MKMYESTTIVKPTLQTNLYISVTIHQIPRIKDNSSLTSITQTVKVLQDSDDVAQLKLLIHRSQKCTYIHLMQSKLLGKAALF